MDSKVVNNEKKGRIWLGAALILIVAIIVAGVNIYKNKTESKNIFKNAISETFDYLEKELNNNYKTATGEFTLSTNIKASDEDTSAIFDIINNVDLSGKYGIDYQNKIMSIDLDSKYNSKDLVKALMYFEDGNSYIYLDGAYDKYVKVPIEEYDSIFNTITNKDDYKKVLNKLETALNNALKDEYFTESKDGNNTKTSLELTKERLTEVRNSIINDLKNDDEFVKSLAVITEDTESDIKDAMDELLQEEIDEDTTTISIYTKGVKREFVKLEIVSGVDKVLVERDGDKYSFTYTEEDKSMADGYLIISEKNNKYTLEVLINDKESGDSVGFTLTSSNNYNKEVDTKDVSNNVSIDEISEEDMMTIFTNLYKNEGLVEIINAFSGMM